MDGWMDLKQIRLPIFQEGDRCWYNTIPLARHEAEKTMQLAEIEYRQPGDVSRQQITGALHPAKGKTGGPGKGVGNGCLPQPRQFFNQDMTTGKHGDYGKTYHLIFSLEMIGAQRINKRRDGLKSMRNIHSYLNIDAFAKAPKQSVFSLITR